MSMDLMLDINEPPEALPTQTKFSLNGISYNYYVTSLLIFENYYFVIYDITYFTKQY